MSTRLLSSSKEDDLTFIRAVMVRIKTKTQIFIYFYPHVLYVLMLSIFIDWNMFLFSSVYVFMNKYIEDIHFLLNMAFISSSEVDLYFMSGEATNKIYIFFTSRVK